MRCFISNQQVHLQVGIPDRPRPHCPRRPCCPRPSRHSLPLLLQPGINGKRHFEEVQQYIFSFLARTNTMEIWSISWCVVPRLRLFQLSSNDWGAGRAVGLLSAVRNHIGWIAWPSLGPRSLCLAILSVTAVNSWHGTMRVIIHCYYKHFTEMVSHNRIQSNKRPIKNPEIDTLLPRPKDFLFLCHISTVKKY